MRQKQKKIFFFCLSCKMNAFNLDKTYRGKIKKRIVEYGLSAA